YLNVAVEMGVIGLTLLLTAVIGQLRAASRCRKDMLVLGNIGGVIIAYEAACYATLAAAFFIDIIWEKCFWLAWMLLAVAVRTQQQSAQRIGDHAPGSERAAWPWHNLQERSAPGMRMC